MPLKPSRQSVLEPGGEYDGFVAEAGVRNEFSGTVLLIQRGRTVLSRSYGLVNSELSIPNGPDTIYRPARSPRCSPASRSANSPSRTRSPSARRSALT